MSIGDVISLLRDGIFQILILIAPPLISALVVGLIVAIFLATTSIQEQSLTFLPKLVTILIVVALVGGWMFTNLGSYTINLFNRIPDLAR